MCRGTSSVDGLVIILELFCFCERTYKECSPIYALQYLNGEINYRRLSTLAVNHRYKGNSEAHEVLILDAERLKTLHKRL